MFNCEIMGRTPSNSEAALSMIRKTGMRATAARVNVLNALLSADHALTHHELEQAVDVKGGGIQRVTLYRVLDWLVNQELAHKITGSDRVWRFSAQSHAKPHHAHFNCTHCGQVYCLENLSPAVAGRLPKGFRLEHADVSVQGVCPHCSN